MKPRLKAQIRLKLFRRAASGDFPRYEQFYRRLTGNKWGSFRGKRTSMR
jgi:hypothetical protein